jgi:transketolase
VTHNGPYYIRLGKTGESILHPHLAESSILPGMIPIIDNKNKTAVLSTGTITPFVLEKIQSNKFSYDLWSVPYIKPIDETLLSHIANNAQCIITVEEHQLEGGFGSIILETLYDLKAQNKIKELPEVRRIGIKDPLSNIGTQDYMRNKMDFSIF